MGESTHLQVAKTWLAENGTEFLVNLIVFFIIIIAGKILISCMRKATRTVLDRSDRLNDMLKKFTVDVLGKVLWVIVLMVALKQVGIDIAPLIAGLGVTGFIFGFAFKDSLGNLAAGIMIMVNQPFSLGHYVQAAGHAGTVTELNLMATILTTPDNKRITIPNSAIWGESIVNYSANDIRRIDMTVGVDYGADLVKTKTVLTEVVAQQEQVLADPAPTIEVAELADSSVNFVVRPWVKTGDYWTVFFNLQQQIKQSLDAAGIGIPFPQVDVHVSKE